MKNFHDELLIKIIDAISVEDGKLAIHDKLFVAERWGTVVLSELLEEEGYQKKFEGIRYLWYPQQLVPIFSPPFYEIFKELKIEGNISFEKFKEKTDCQIEKIKTDVTPKKYRFLYPVRLEYSSPPEKIESDGITVEFKIYDDIKEIFAEKKLSEELSEYLTNYSNSFTPSSYQYLEVSVYARNLWFAEKKATRLAQLTISIFAYIQNYGKMTRTFIGPSKEITNLDLEIIFAFSGEGFEGFLFKTTKLGNKRHNFSTEQIGYVNDIIKVYKNSHSSIQDNIEDGFISFHSGLTESRSGYAFLNFWTAAEIFCLKNESVKESQIIKRLMSPMKEKSEIVKHELSRLYRIRNYIVHNADYSLATEYDRNLMQFYIEPFIAFFIQNLHNFHRIQIEKIFQYLDESDENLIKDKELIDFVTNLRKKKEPEPYAT